MHFSWKSIWLYRLALAALMPIGIALLAATMSPAPLLWWLLEPTFRIFGVVGSYLVCTIVLLGCWIGFFVLLVALRERLRIQQEARAQLEPLHWQTSRMFAMSRDILVEVLRRSGAMLAIRADGETFWITEHTRDGIGMQLRLTQNELINLDDPTERMLPYVVSELLTDINVHANQLRINIG